ncbi:hypothetical protein Anapl_12203 [Anas platyrhynchos]|uniref:Uncharacterized protein n=1 Tax=Anas platyrhynchos TaxID=8839 RepID=R0K1G4_ANAPL|nr:hypothetical protein Anapl_12203 [Anas platyrhynchos]
MLSKVQQVGKKACMNGRFKMTNTALAEEVKYLQTSYFVGPVPQADYLKQNEKKLQNQAGFITGTGPTISASSSFNIKQKSVGRRPGSPASQGPEGPSAIVWWHAWAPQACFSERTQKKRFPRLILSLFYDPFSLYPNDHNLIHNQRNASDKCHPTDHLLAIQTALLCPGRHQRRRLPKLSGSKDMKDVID